MFNFSFKQQVLTGFVISLLFVLISALSSYMSIKSLAKDSAWQTHTHEVIALAQKLDIHISNAETGLRGYIITQDRKYLDPYIHNIDKVMPTVADLRLKLSDNPVQQTRLDSMSLYAGQKTAIMKETLQTNNLLGRQAAVDKMLTDKGRSAIDNMRRISQTFVNEEKHLLAERYINTASGIRRTILVVLLSSLTIFGLILFLFSYIKRTFDGQKLTEERILQTNVQLEKISSENQQKNWLLSGATLLAEKMRGEQEIKELTTNIITGICNYINAPIGALFLVNRSQKTLKLMGSYAYQLRGINTEYAFGEGLHGQVALEKQSKLLRDVPEDYIRINSGLGNIKPLYIYLIPVVFEEQTISVLEFGLNKEPDDATLLFLNTVCDSIGIALNSGVARVKLKHLFEQTQQQAEELESQQEELRTTNEELMFKSEQLQASEEELRVQQEELRQTNAELEEKAQQLEEQNISVNQAREAIKLKADELEISSKYKSEFLANMSHELRTPLNSILILARILKENKPENLNGDQIKYASVIHTAGGDLLTLINDILDLSKIESGKVDLTVEPVSPAEIKRNLESLFAELARSKKITFKIEMLSGLPEKILTDPARLAQIIKNLLSNAFKFTPENGTISLTIRKAEKDSKLHSAQLKGITSDIIAFSIKDSGIGIPPEKQKLIFEAFQQVDGSTSRKYGGTGLGLSISKELANLLGGEIQIDSNPGMGSTFTLFIPKDHNFAHQTEESNIPQKETIFQSALLEAVIPPATKREKQIMLIIEDDKAFAEVLKDYAAEKGFDPLIAHSGDIGLEMALAHLPDAIVLDIMLPVMDGWMVLRKLKNDPKTHHIPVHMMSAGEEKVDKAKKEGAIGFLRKPVEKEELDKAFELLSTAHSKFNFKTVLVIEDQELQSRLLTDRLRENGIEVEQAFTGAAALELLKNQSFDCIILDLNLPDISGFDLLDKIKSKPDLLHTPVIINTAMELDQEKMAHIMKYTEAMVLKSYKSNDRLIDEVSLFMNKLKQQESHTFTSRTYKLAGKNASTREKALRGKRILITDDDMRNIFALSSALQEYDIQITIANNGKEALNKLDKNNIDLVLMDIMMPEMDGYEAMKAIRLDKRFSKLPIIALTAKAMKNDREKCIEAGANDYISKPVDIDRLLSMMRVWLS